ncbi:hypothetical protein BDV06DRAFT_225084 [Aspergillus oleicola]
MAEEPQVLSIQDRIRALKQAQAGQSPTSEATGSPFPGPQPTAFALRPASAQSNGIYNGKYCEVDGFEAYNSWICGKGTGMGYYRASPVATEATEHSACCISRAPQAYDVEQQWALAAASSSAVEPEYLHYLDGE